MGPTEDKVFTLPLLSQNCAAVLYATVQIWDSGTTCGDRRWICDSKAANSKSLIVMSPCGGNSERRRNRIFVEKRKPQTNYWPVRDRQTPPILAPEASVDPSHEGGEGSSSHRWVG